MGRGASGAQESSYYHHNDREGSHRDDDDDQEVIFIAWYSCIKHTRHTKKTHLTDT